MNQLFRCFIILGAFTFIVVSIGRTAGANSDTISFTMRLGNQNFNTASATGKFLVVSGTPNFQAVVVRYSPSGGFTDISVDELDKAAIWTPYDGIIRMNFGPKDGVYDVRLCLKGTDPGSQSGWIGTLVTVTRTKPEVVITSPTNSIVTQPYLQLKGSSQTELASVKYDISNTKGSVTNQDGLTAGDDLDIQTGKYTAHYFQCYDILLATGLNVIALHVTDRAGNVFTTNLSVTLDYSVATPPVIQLLWPKDGMEICGNSFTLRGLVQDASSLVLATITDSNGTISTIHGEVERDGKLWAENLPLHDGTNHVVLCVTNSAGQGSTTNFQVVHSSFVLRMDSTKGDLWLPTITVSGYESDGTYPVWVNGVKASVSISGDGSGKWVAQNVPVTKGGVASFDIYAYGPDEIQPDGLYGNGKLVRVKNVGTNSEPLKKLVSKNTATPAVMPLLGIPVQPILINIADSNAIIYFTWNTVSNQTYQLQYATDLISSNWNNLGQPIRAITNSVSTTDTIDHDGHRFYRVFLLP
jgi:hypothetical protein